MNRQDTASRLSMSNVTRCATGGKFGSLTPMSATVGEAVDNYIATRRWAAGTRKHASYTLHGFAGVERLRLTRQPHRQPRRPRRP
jgi:hypothetical protein